MKSLGLIIIALLFSTSCSVDVSGAFDGTPIRNDTYFTPPIWIQGEWAGEYVNIYGTTISKDFRFTQNDFIANGISLNERINALSTEYLSDTEQITNTNYIVTILHLSINKDIYNFKYVSNSEITCTYESGVLNDWDNREIENYILSKK
ncbi:MAG: hypothetical protein CVU01_04400 [Bacteroidetes bacterium HGW-Bacteroidetes-18]|nr:MAG: hypothetical protein CVU01_04400 [Bacteroidetes bacterium HGW-Bacteroidetes-18]